MLRLMTVTLLSALLRAACAVACVVFLATHLISPPGCDRSVRDRSYYKFLALLRSFGTRCAMIVPLCTNCPCL
eukprot:1602168-Amphidinium_carterae.1